MGFLHRKKADTQEPFSLSLTGEEGEQWLEFPGEVVASVRQMIARTMRTDPFPEKLVIASAVRQEGVTYLSRAIGTVLANDFDRSCCVIELNWWWPADYPQAFIGRPGVADVLQEKTTLEEALILTGMDNLALLPAGNLAARLRPTFAGSEALANLIASASERFDHLILDIPAVTATSDAILMAAFGTALCLVIRQGVTPVQRVRTALDDLDHLNVIGVMMNQVHMATPAFIMDYIAQE